MTLCSILGSILIGAGCASDIGADTCHDRFRSASEIAFVDGLHAVRAEAQSVVVLPADGMSHLDGEWSDRRNLETRHVAQRAEHAFELEDTLRANGWSVIPCEDDVLRRLRRQHARIADADFVSLATHIGSSLGADVVIVPRLDFHYETKLDASRARWVSVLDWEASYRFIDVQSDTEVAVRCVDTREPFSVIRWVNRGTMDQVMARAASAMRSTGEGVESIGSAWLALHLMFYGVDISESQHH